MALDSGNEKNFYARLNRRRVLGWKRLKPFKSIFNWNKWSITPLLIIRASLLFLRSAAVSINQNIRTTADISSKLQCQNRAHMSSHLALIRSYPGRGGKGGGVGGVGAREEALNIVLHKWAPPWGPSPLPFHFWQERSPFRIPFIDNWYLV